MTFAEKWIDLEIITLSELSQTQSQISHFLSLFNIFIFSLCICNLKVEGAFCGGKKVSGRSEGAKREGNGETNTCNNACYLCVESRFKFIYLSVYLSIMFIYLIYHQSLIIIYIVSLASIFYLVFFGHAVIRGTIQE